MTEDFLHYIWQHQLLNKENLFSVNNERIELISPGTHNTDAGPDFSNSRIKINDTIWAGNIEIHTDSANWKAHKHHTDKAYNNVILHVVSKYTQPAFNANGNEIPTFELIISDDIKGNYQKLKASTAAIPCSPELNIVNSFTLKMWLDRLCIERLEDKTEIIKTLLKQNNNNWEESFYLILAKSFGFKTNALPFEMLARLTPFKLIEKYSSKLHQLESLLFGQAGFLEVETNDTYSEALSKEYRYLSKIHKLKPIEKHLWKFLRLRPSNFPIIRIAQFAALINNSSRLFSKILDAKDIKTLQKLLSCKVSDYWKTHYTFGKTSNFQDKKIGITAINGLLINTIIPFLFIYGKERGLDEVCARAINFLELLPNEKNSIITKWIDNKVIATNAAQSQALIQLYNNYCTEKNCLYCQIGNSIIQHR